MFSNYKNCFNITCLEELVLQSRVKNVVWTQKDQLEICYISPERNLTVKGDHITRCSGGKKIFPKSFQCGKICERSIYRSVSMVNGTSKGDRTLALHQGLSKENKNKTKTNT